MLVDDDCVPAGPLLGLYPLPTYDGEAVVNGGQILEWVAGTPDFALAGAGYGDNAEFARRWSSAALATRWVWRGRRRSGAPARSRAPHQPGRAQKGRSPTRMFPGTKEPISVRDFAPRVPPATSMRRTPDIVPQSLRDRPLPTAATSQVLNPAYESRMLPSP